MILLDNIFLLPAKLPTLFFNPASRSGLQCAWCAAHGVKLAAEFLTAKAHPDQLQTSVNTILAEGWREAAEEADPGELASRAEDFGLDAIPPETLIVTAGVDVQHDRLETTFLGHGREESQVLGHVVIGARPATSRHGRNSTRCSGGRGGIRAAGLSGSTRR